MKDWREQARACGIPTTDTEMREQMSEAMGFPYWTADMEAIVVAIDIGVGSREHHKGYIDALTAAGIGINPLREDASDVDKEMAEEGAIRMDRYYVADKGKFLMAKIRVT